MLQYFDPSNQSFEEMRTNYLEIRISLSMQVVVEMN